MKRRAIQVVVLLLLGAIVNVVVAWSLLAIASHETWSDAGPPRGVDTEWWQATAPTGREIRDTPLRVNHHKGFGWQTAYMIEMRRTEPLQPRGHACERRMLGWPLLSLQSTLWSFEGRYIDWRGIVFLFSKDWPSEPIWIGTVINTIFYAAIVWVVWFTPGALRRMIRRRRCLVPGMRVSDRHISCLHRMRLSTPLSLALTWPTRTAATDARERGLG